MLTGENANFPAVLRALLLLFVKGVAAGDCSRYVAFFFFSFQSPASQPSFPWRVGEPVPVQLSFHSVSGLYSYEEPSKGKAGQ